MTTNSASLKHFPWKDAICIVLLILGITTSIGFIIISYRGTLAQHAAPLAVLADSLLAAGEVLMPKVLALGGILCIGGGIAFSGLFRPLR